MLAFNYFSSLFFLIVSFEHGVGRRADVAAVVAAVVNAAVAAEDAVALQHAAAAVVAAAAFPSCYGAVGRRIRSCPIRPRDVASSSPAR